MGSAQILVKIGGIFTVGIAIFHLFFWQLFHWKSELRKLKQVNRAIMQVLNLFLTLCFFFFGYISLVHTTDLISTSLGMELIFFMGAFWLLRAVLQPCFFSARHPLSIGMTVLFLFGSSVYFLSWYLQEI